VPLSLEELTYSQFSVSDEEDLTRLVKGEPLTLRYDE
jgi:hypothetical protein